MSKKKLIFPVNWPAHWKKRDNEWKQEKVQKNICPKCHHYTGRYFEDKWCQKCGYEPAPFYRRPPSKEHFIDRWANRLQDKAIIGPGTARIFIRKLLKAWERKNK